MLGPGIDSTARLHREREFHDSRFTKESRESQHKFYFALAGGIAHFNSEVARFADAADCLEYGCGPRPLSLTVGSTARSVAGIDISPVAVAAATELAKNGGQEAWRFETMNAERMAFEDESFDLVFGSGIIHHLDVRAAGTEVARVLRPGGTALFWEPLGENPLWNIYRRRTPEARTEDEHPLRRHHLDVLAQPFNSIDVACFGLTTIASVPFRSTRAGNRVRSGLERLDQLLFRSSFVSRNAWFAAVKLTK